MPSQPRPSKGKPAAGRAKGSEPPRRKAPEPPRRKGSVMDAQRRGMSPLLTIGVVAVLLLVAVIVFGLMRSTGESTPVGDGYGSSTATASLSAAGVVTIGTGGVVLDVYEDPLCPVCGAFERKYGQQMAAAIDKGELTINYHGLTFLNAASASGDYSTRAWASLQCVAGTDGATGGVWARYHSLLFSDVQPKEGSNSDHSNEQLGNYANKSGASAAAYSCIVDGANRALAVSTDSTSQAELTAATGRVSSPTVLRNGQSVNFQSERWLTDLLAGGA